MTSSTRPLASDRPDLFDTGLHGCSFTEAFCDFTFLSDKNDHDLTTRVQINGSSALTVTAVIPAVCGSLLC